MHCSGVHAVFSWGRRMVVGLMAFCPGVGIGYVLAFSLLSALFLGYVQFVERGGLSFGERFEQWCSI